MSKTYIYYTQDPTDSSRGLIRAIAPGRLRPVDVQDGWQVLEVDWRSALDLMEGNADDWYVDLSQEEPVIVQREQETVYSSLEPNLLVSESRDNAAVRFSLIRGELHAELDSAYNPDTIRSSHLVVVAHAKSDPRIPMGFAAIPVERFMESRQQPLGIFPGGDFWLLVRGPYKSYSLETNHV